MKGMSSTDIVLIIGAFFTGICSVIAALKANRGAKNSESNRTKLDEVHTKVNGNLETLKNENDHLRRLVIEMTVYISPEIYSAICRKVEVDEALIGKRRKGDFSGV
jgi:hypothetical protein